MAMCLKNNEMAVKRFVDEKSSFKKDDRKGDTKREFIKNSKIATKNQIMICLKI